MSGADHEERLRAGVGVEELGVALGGRPADERSRLRPHGRRCHLQVRLHEAHQAQAGHLRHEARALRRHAGLQAGLPLLIISPPPAGPGPSGVLRPPAQAPPHIDGKRCSMWEEEELTPTQLLIRGSRRETWTCIAERRRVVGLIYTLLCNQSINFFLNSQKIGTVYLYKYIQDIHHECICKPLLFVNFDHNPCSDRQVACFHLLSAFQCSNLVCAK